MPLKIIPELSLVIGLLASYIPFITCFLPQAPCDRETVRALACTA